MKEHTRKVTRTKQMRPPPSVFARQLQPLQVREGETGARLVLQCSWESSRDNPVSSCPVSKAPEKPAAAAAMSPGRPGGVKRIQQGRERSPTLPTAANPAHQGRRRNSELLPVSSRGSSRQSFYCLSSGAVSVFVFISVLSLCLSPH